MDLARGTSQSLGSPAEPAPRVQRLSAFRSNPEGPCFGTARVTHLSRRLARANRRWGARIEPSPPVLRTDGSPPDRTGRHKVHHQGIHGGETGRRTTRTPTSAHGAQGMALEPESQRKATIRLGDTEAIFTEGNFREGRKVLVFRDEEPDVSDDASASENASAPSESLRGFSAKPQKITNLECREDGRRVMAGSHPRGQPRGSPGPSACTGNHGCP